MWKDVDVEYDRKLIMGAIHSSDLAKEKCLPEWNNSLALFYVTILDGQNLNDTMEI